jgi:hypothetical protein
MNRILFTLASISIILLLAAQTLGLVMGDLHAMPQPSKDTLYWATVHRLTGFVAALGVVLVESIVVTYFIGTSRWCREVVETYRLDASFVARSNRLKRRTFPWALTGMLSVIAVAALGAAADPGRTNPLNARAWADWHLIGSFMGIAVIAWTYVVAWNNVLANHAVIERVMAEVSRIRRERGLDADMTTLQTAESATARG